jgi:hypothetical protein
VSRTKVITLVAGWRPLALRSAVTLKIPGNDSSHERFLLSLRTGTAVAPMLYVPLDPWNIRFDMIRTWIKDCREKHTLFCNEPQLDILASASTTSSTQVIDCLERSIVTLPSGSEYLALSYVWGHAHDSKKEVAAQSSQPIGVLPFTLPKTIEDAMTVTLQLGFKVLWIDKYCINQDTTEHEIMAQLASMDMIYQGGLVTIVAAAGDDADFGLPGVSDRNRLGHSSITINRKTWYSGFRDIYTPVLSSKWNTRGWTYQEAHFSRRLLIFTSEQVVFECSTGKRCEAMRQEGCQLPSHTNDILGHRPGESRSLLTLSKHIELYSHRSLTNDSDALNALRGLFASFSRANEPIQQYWGLPLSMAGYGESLIGGSSTKQNLLNVALAHGLLWKTTTKSAPPIERRWDFPSWSWTGWKAPIKWSGSATNHLIRICPARFAAVWQDGTTETLTAELAKNIFEDKNNNASLYTYDLCIEAEILQLKFNVQTRGHVFARATVDVPSSDSAQCYWQLDFTLAMMEPDDEYHFKERTFDCIVLNDVYGLVVWKIQGKNERFGRIKLRGNMVGATHMSGPELIEHSHLRMHFPGSRRAIVLG